MEPWQVLGRIDGGIQNSHLAQIMQKVPLSALYHLLPVQLPGIETQGVSSARGMALQAFGSTGNAPSLRHLTLLGLHVKIDVHPFFTHQDGIATVFLPTITQSVNTIFGFDQEPGLDPHRGCPIIPLQWQFEMLDPNRPRGKGPGEFPVVADGGIGDGNPTGFDAVVRPERQVGFIGHDSILRLQVNERFEGAGFR